MIIEALVDYIEENGIATFETDMFIGELPFDKNDCISLLYVPSPEPDKAIPYYTQMIDVRGRFTSYQDGYAKMLEIFRLIHAVGNFTMGDFHVYLSYAAGLPVDNDRDIERRHLLQLSLGFIYREEPALS